MRKDARKVAFSLIYEYIFTQQADDGALQQFLESYDADEKKFDLDEQDVEFVKNIYNGTVNNFNDYRNRVAALAKGFKEERLFKVDLAILMMALYELECTDTPAPVVINEAVNLGKIYSTENSAGFINGILAQYLKDTNN